MCLAHDPSTRVTIKAAVSGLPSQADILCLRQEHQLHQPLHLRLRLLRLQQGAHRGGAAGRALPAALRRDRAAHARGLVAGGLRDLHAGGDPPRVHRCAALSWHALLPSPLSAHVRRHASMQEHRSLATHVPLQAEAVRRHYSQVASSGVSMRIHLWSVGRAQMVMKRSGVQARHT